MFQRRLAIMLLGMTLLALLVGGRLIQLQLLRADDFDSLALRLATRPPRYLPAPRGAIRDREGRVLLADEPSADVSVHYSVLTYSNRARYLSTLARAMRRRGEFPADQALPSIVDTLQQRVTDMWVTLEQLSDVPPEEFVTRAEGVRRRVEYVRGLRAQRGQYGPLREEYMLHPILSGVDDRLALDVRLELANLPWLDVIPSTRRISADADAVAHLLGRTGEVGRDHLDRDPEADDPLRLYRPGDQIGTSGVERLAERVLRGTRGVVQVDIDGRELNRVEPIRGQDVFLSIDAELQADVVEILRRAVEEGSVKYPSGAAAVVIDARTREIVALASYPTFAYDTYRDSFPRLRRDTRRRPLLSRALQSACAPGSTCKAITLVAGLTEGVVTPETRIHCNGYLLPERRNRYRCWIYNRPTPSTHDAAEPDGQNAALAIKNSCNIYFYKTGGKLGTEVLCKWFDIFGLGATSGTGLIEETPGVNPDDEWMRARGLRREAGDIWNYSIGQGHVTATPLQVANVAASVAIGHWEPTKLVRDSSGNWLGVENRHAQVRALPEHALRPLRDGMWQVVNQFGGTGRRAKINIDGYEMLGKTGSAQTVPHIVTSRYTFESADGTRETIIAPTDVDARARRSDPEAKLVGRRAAERYPSLLPNEKTPAHAWFMGYTQRSDTPRGAAPQGDCYAIAVLIEFGLSGGQAAAPVAKEIAERVLTPNRDVNELARHP